MFHVYQESECGKFVAVETSGSNSVKEVDALLPSHVNWYGVDAESEDDAISKVMALKPSLYKSPDEMKNLEAMLKEYQTN